MVDHPLREVVDELLRLVAGPDQLGRWDRLPVLGLPVLQDSLHGCSSLCMPSHLPTPRGHGGGTLGVLGLGVGRNPSLPEVQLGATFQHK